MLAPPPPPRPPASAGVLPRLREALAAQGYDKEGLLAYLRPFQGRDRHLDTEIIALHAREAPGLPRLCRLFLLGEALARDELGTVLPCDLAEELLACGLLVPRGAGVASMGQLTPLEDLLLLSDFGPRVTGRPYAPDFVLGAGSATLNLAGLAPPRPSGTVLDLGAGGGVLSLLAARGGGRVVATDTSPRALAFAAFNAALHGADNIEFRQGSLYGPVAGETFDLLLSNPPFVISPERERSFRTASDLEGDAVTEAVVRGAGPALRPDGLAVVLLNWHHRTDEDWAERPLSWLADEGLGRWLLCFDTEEPLAYAARWIREEQPGLRGEALRAEADRWMAYYRRLGAERVSAGAVVLHRPPSGAGWTRVERMARDVYRQGPCGGQIERIARSESLLAGAGRDEDLLGRAFRPAGEHSLRHELRLSGGRWTLVSETLALSRGLGLAGSIDAQITALLQHLDGGRPLGGALRDTAALLGADFAAVRGPALDVVRHLLRAGLLEPLA